MNLFQYCEICDYQKAFCVCGEPGTDYDDEWDSEDDFLELFILSTGGK